jgi:transcriptional regulator with XRE-family HTH domain
LTDCIVYDTISLVTLGARVGARIRQRRTARGWSQATLAERAGLGRVTVARIELGTQDASLTTLGALATALGVPLRSLLPGRRKGDRR